MRKRTVFDGVFAAYVAALVAPPLGEYAGSLAYLGAFAGVWLVVYAGASEAESLPDRVGRRPTATFLIVFPLVYGVAYIIGALVAEPPVRSPYVYLGLWSVGVGIVVVAVARETAGVGDTPKRARRES